MAILAVNAGSSTLKFSLHPVNDGQVEACILTGSIQGLEPKGQPELSYSYLAQLIPIEDNRHSSVITSL